VNARPQTAADGVHHDCDYGLVIRPGHTWGRLGAVRADGGRDEERIARGCAEREHAARGRRQVRAVLRADPLRDHWHECTPEERVRLAHMTAELMRLAADT
jgi:hypothetical protein